MRESSAQWHDVVSGAAHGSAHRRTRSPEGERAAVEPVSGGALWWPREQTQGRLVNLVLGVRGRRDGGSGHG
jgi:hypothetical protein